MIQIRSEPIALLVRRQHLLAICLFHARRKFAGESRRREAERVMSMYLDMRPGAFLVKEADQYYHVWLAEQVTKHWQRPDSPWVQECHRVCARQVMDALDLKEVH